VQVLVPDDEWTRGARAALQRIAHRLGAGDALSTAMAGEPALFDGATADLVRVAEALPPAQQADALAALALDARRQAAASRDVAITMTWPLTLGAVLLVELFVCTAYVRPQILAAFDAMRATVALPLMATSVLDTWWAWLLPLYVLLLLWTVGWLPRALRSFLADLGGRIGFVGRWRAAAADARLLDWLPLCEARPALRRPILAHLLATTSSGPARAALGRLDTALAGGAALAEAVAAQRALPSRMALLVGLGDRSATLPAVLQDLRRDAEENETLAFTRFERGCVVLSYALIGYLVATLLIGIYLPIFKIGTLL
jgi:type IV pilus assembly protein PilC